MLIGLVAAPGTLMGTGVVQSVGDSQGRVEGTPADL
jgi:hypothetical protein